MNLLTIILQTGGAPGGGGLFGGGGTQMIVMMLLIVAVFYFFMIRPQSKRQKEIRKFRESLQTGDKVITSGGIHGRIKEVKDDSVLLEIADNVRIKVDKASIFATAADTQQANK
ncbi:MAG: preprotein translocase subunit YajC [Candidatus Azobacteroides sp.]|nr:preprotein translocase subunit YajC [Candidatus Azobacteroides sp.]